MWVGVLYGVYNSEPKASNYKHDKDQMSKFTSDLYGIYNGFNGTFNVK